MFYSCMCWSTFGRCHFCMLLFERHSGSGDCSCVKACWPGLHEANDACSACPCCLGRWFWLQGVFVHKWRQCTERSALTIWWVQSTVSAYFSLLKNVSFCVPRKFVETPGLQSKDLGHDILMNLLFSLVHDSWVKLSVECQLFSGRELWCVSRALYLGYILRTNGKYCCYLQVFVFVQVGFILTIQDRSNKV